MRHYSRTRGKPSRQDRIKLDNYVGDDYYSDKNETILVIEDREVEYSPVLGPDGENLIYVREYNPGFIDFSYIERR